MTAARLAPRLLLFVALATSCRLGGVGPTRPYDLVIRGGRVMDPESGLDAVRHVGIAEGKIAAVSAETAGRYAVLDAGGLVVAPGFIDLHAHGQDDENYALRAADGVTTALELEVGTGDVERFYAERAGRTLINYGASIGHVPVRMAVMGEPPAFLPVGHGPDRDPAGERGAARGDQRRVRAGLAAGALAVGMGIQYTPAASRWEILEVFREAARFSASGARAHAPQRRAGAAQQHQRARGGDRRRRRDRRPAARRPPALDQRGLHRPASRHDRRRAQPGASTSPPSVTPTPRA